MGIKLSKKKRIVLIIVIIIAVLLYLFSTSFKTPEIKGVVVDAETGKSMEGAYISASWSRTYSGPGGPSGGGISKEVKITTKADGAFVIPKHTVINLVPYPFGQGGSFGMSVYAHRCKIKRFAFYDTKQAENPKYEEFSRSTQDGFKIMRIKMHELKDDEKYYFQLIESFEFKDYHLEDMRFFLEKFSNSSWADKVQWEIGNYYVEHIKDYANAIKEYELLIKKYPKSRFVPDAQKNIERIRKMQRGVDK